MLSAAHCFDDDDDGSFRARSPVKIGVHDKTNDGNPEYDVCGVEGGGGCGSDEAYVVRHPLFDSQNPALADFDNDIALIILPNEVNGITPVSLNVNSSVPATSAELEVFGWGRRVANDADSSPDTPFIVSMEYLSNSACSTQTEFKITDNMLCATDSDGTDSTCRGDSGT